MIYLPRLSKINQEYFGINFHKTREINYFFVLFDVCSFTDVKETKDELFFYDSSKLISKCIILKTNKANKYLISEFIICDEHE